MKKRGRFVRAFLGMSDLGCSAVVPKSPHGPPADYFRLKEDDYLDIGGLLTSGVPDPRSGIKADFDRLCVACEQAGVEKPATMAKLVAVDEAKPNVKQKSPPQLALIKSQAERTAALSAHCSS